MISAFETRSKLTVDEAVQSHGGHVRQENASLISVVHCAGLDRGGSSRSVGRVYARVTVSELYPSSPATPRRRPAANGWQFEPVTQGWQVRFRAVRLYSTERAGVNVEPTATLRGPA